MEADDLLRLGGGSGAGALQRFHNRSVHPIIDSTRVEAVHQLTLI
eukprot:COSAG05_NODE_20939_length_275_cov_1.460227_1_plen_44_part_10